MLGYYTIGLRAYFMVSNKVFALLSFFVATSIRSISWSTFISAVIQNEPSSVSATMVMVLLSAFISSILTFTSY